MVRARQDQDQDVVVAIKMTDLRVGAWGKEKRLHWMVTTTIRVAQAQSERARTRLELGLVALAYKVLEGSGCCRIQTAHFDYCMRKPRAPHCTSHEAEGHSNIGRLGDPSSCGRESKWSVAIQ